MPLVIEPYEAMRECSGAIVEDRKVKNRAGNFNYFNKNCSIWLEKSSNSRPSKFYVLVKSRNKNSCPSLDMCRSNKISYAYGFSWWMGLLLVGSVGKSMLGWGVS